MYVAGEGGERIDHVLKELVAGKGKIILRVRPAIKLSGCQEILLKSKNWKFIVVVGSTKTKTGPVVVC